MNKRQRKKRTHWNRAKSYDMPLRLLVYDKENYLTMNDHMLSVAYHFLARELKKLGMSLYGWCFFEHPAEGFYDFHWRKKRKDISLYVDKNTDKVTIYITDSNLNFSHKYNTFEVADLSTALHHEAHGHNSKIWRGEHGERKWKTGRWSDILKRCNMRHGNE